ncbi:MAG: 3-deoxy-7-phosphoheptulonate synthase [Patescibacteria group bacterium]
MSTQLRHRVARMTNIRIRSEHPLPSPAQLKADLPMTEKAWKTIGTARKIGQRILRGVDPRFMLVLGPCSVHSTEDCLEYGRWLSVLQKKFGSRIFFMMRLCFSKPRTKPDWTGFWSDPDLDGSYDIEKGWREGRRLALDLSELGIPIATEYNDIPGQQRFDDLYSLYWIGAREVTNQQLRQVASALSCPVGFKNPISGPLQPALDSLAFAKTSHSLPAVSDSGIMAKFETTGNPDGFLILRGTHHGPNYCPEQVAEAQHALTAQGLSPRLVVDFSHANSGKDHKAQIEVCRSVANQVASGVPIFGGLYESNLLDGSQKIVIRSGQKPTIESGVSITDSCDGLGRSHDLIKELFDALGNR